MTTQVSNLTSGQTIDARCDWFTTDLLGEGQETLQVKVGRKYADGFYHAATHQTQDGETVKGYLVDSERGIIFTDQKPYVDTKTREQVKRQRNPELPPLPKVVYIENLQDTGEDSGARCPHCGAEGRYIYWFRCEDGKLHGAMKGCFKLFPKSKFAELHEKLLAKQADYQKKGWKLASWDQEVVGAIEAHGRGEISEIAVQNAIGRANGARAAWKYGKKYR